MSPPETQCARGLRACSAPVCRKFPLVLKGWLCSPRFWVIIRILNFDYPHHVPSGRPRRRVQLQALRCSAGARRSLCCVGFCVGRQHPTPLRHCTVQSGATETIREKENNGNKCQRKKPPDRRLVCLMEWTNKPYLYNRKPDNRKPDTESQTNKPPDRETGSPPPHQRSSPLQPNKQASPETAFDPKLGHRKPCIRVICTVLLSIETAWPRKGPKNPKRTETGNPGYLAHPLGSGQNHRGTSRRPAAPLAASQRPRAAAAADTRTREPPRRQSPARVPTRGC